jgi:hypothetical protein
MVMFTMQAVRTYEALVKLRQSARRYNPEDSHLHPHSRENLKSYRVILPSSISFINTNTQAKEY